MGNLFKVLKNKKNNQLMIALSRKKLDLRKKDPVAMEIDKIKFHYEKNKRRGKSL